MFTYVCIMKWDYACKCGTHIGQRHRSSGGCHRAPDPAVLCLQGSKVNLYPVCSIQTKSVAEMTPLYTIIIGMKAS